MNRPDLIRAICDSVGNGDGNKFIEASAQHIADGAAYIAHLEARVEELEAANAWQPIETAPRDGSRFVCWPWVNQRTYDSEPVIGRYHTNALGDVMLIAHGGKKTHWRPLPSPPEGD